MFLVPIGSLVLVTCLCCLRIVVDDVDKTSYRNAAATAVAGRLVVFQMSGWFVVMLLLPVSPNE